MIDNEIKNSKTSKKQLKPLFVLSAFEINVLILYFISILTAIISEKNTKYLIAFIIITMIVFYVKTIFFNEEKPSFDFVGFVGLGIFAIPLVSIGFFLAIDKIFQVKELRIKENTQYGIEYIKDYVKYDYVYKIYVNSIKEIKEINELDFYNLKYNNCQSIKIITEYYDKKSIFIETKNLTDKEKQDTYLKDEIISEKIVCNEND